MDAILKKRWRWTKKFDPCRLTQYESARYRNYDVTYDYSNLDLYSRMYPAMNEIEEYLEEDESKPFLLVEYCHAMGNGPGDLEDYFQLIQKDDRMCGGFVWEWCDHALPTEKRKAVKPFIIMVATTMKNFTMEIFVWMAWYSQTVLLILGF